jgi:pilus assembly protein Flp/PilA
MKTILSRFWKDETGATAIEYGLIAAGIAIAIIAAVQGVGTKLSTNFDTISTSLK